MLDIKRVCESYNIVWSSQSRHAGESMPLGGYDTGCNVWVENNEILLYMAQSGCFDEAGRMAKAGRVRISLTPNPFEDSFSQELKLYEGYISITGIRGEKKTDIMLWADACSSCINIDMHMEHDTKIVCTYETWRGKSNAFKNPDEIEACDGQILFYHRNKGTPVFDERIGEQGLESIASCFPNVEKNRTFGGVLHASNMVFCGMTDGIYAENPFEGYMLQTVSPVTSQSIRISLHQSQAQNMRDWQEELDIAVRKSADDPHANIKTQKWWAGFWNRSHVWINAEKADQKDKNWQVGRNYQLFRYMLGCNAYGEYPTKFNGGLFTVDPSLCSRREGFGSVYPDDRDWGGLIFTAQNQRLVYWPMIKNGDFDMMPPQFNFYKRILTGAKERTKFFFGLEDCACFPEQLDANGLSAFYGKYGLDYPLQVRYHHVEAVEFSFMILEYARASGADISEYIDFISSVIQFYDQFYCGLDASGKRIIFPSTALETFHAAANINIWGREGAEAANYNPDEVAVTNPTDVIAALQCCLTGLLSTEYGTQDQRAGWKRLLEELPPVTTEMKNGYEILAPCAQPKDYVITNCEIPQLNAVYPYDLYGINKPSYDLAVRTYKYAWEHPDQLLHISWHQNGIFAARLGLTDEAHRYMWLKLSDANRRFPAFWGPGHDYVPDHNWGGSGMIGVQEMLLQTSGNTIYLLPAWPKEVDVDFKLRAPCNTILEVSYKSGHLEYMVTPQIREQDVVVCLSETEREEKTNANSVR